MPLDLAIERWCGLGWILFGLSHLLYPQKWADLFLPLRTHENGAFLLGTYNTLLGLFLVVTHNLWTADIRVAVTITGWTMTIKGLLYLFVPRSLSRIMPSAVGLRRGFILAGALFLVLGLWLTWVAFH